MAMRTTGPVKAPRGAWRPPCVAAAAAGALLVGTGPAAAAREPLAILWFQHDQTAVIPANSQNYEPEFDAYDCEAADDFEVPPGEVWRVRTIRIRGTYYDAMGPADSLNVRFYRHANGVPGDILQAYPALPYLEELPGTGWLMATLPEPMKLKPGRYWLSVQVNMAFQFAGQWAWETRAAQRGHPAVWRNPGDGFETGCTSYRPTAECFQLGQGPDYLFTLLGNRQTRR